MENFIREFKHALSPETCQHLISKFEQDSQKQPGHTGAGFDKAKKDSMDLYISGQPGWQRECQTINQAIINAIVRYARLFPFLITGAVSPGILDTQTQKMRAILHDDLEKMGDPQLTSLINAMYMLDGINLQRYTQGQGGYHHWHSEHYPHPTDSSQRTLRRALLWVLYLNDVSEGGETEFYYQQVKIKPVQSSLIIAPCIFTHTHRGHIPTSNDKYVLASWLMYRPAAQLYGQAPTTEKA
ncbi:2OG-Fe(II) oxygenase [Nitrosomonas marina]|uniref:2OG-Fe(II) oxygenase superfamily protein n=1 Tax=Nitrosomonas marina TaxID=917 RepID=A0A1H8CZ47_9PROT|nr:2OG-Fe(II) oxygenase [Nitrosomonas marina]SEM99638.1 2OG-Fe(II) oxygenase superfamily protein [Nitrosomonas marina]